MINQAKVDTVPADELAALEAECKALEEGNTTLIARVKQLTAGSASAVVQSTEVTRANKFLTGLVKIKSTPTDQEVDAQLVDADEMVRPQDAYAHAGHTYMILPLRSDGC